MPALSLRQCAEDIGVAPSTIWRLVTAGRIPALKVGRVFRVESKDWEAAKGSLRYAPPFRAPVITTPTDAKLIDRCRPAAH